MMYIYCFSCIILLIFIIVCWCLYLSIKIMKMQDILDQYANQNQILRAEREILYNIIDVKRHTPMKKWLNYSSEWNRSCKF